MARNLYSKIILWPRYMTRYLYTPTFIWQEILVKTVYDYSIYRSSALTRLLNFEGHPFIMSVKFLILGIVKNISLQAGSKVFCLFPRQIYYILLHLNKSSIFIKYFL